MSLQVWLPLNGDLHNQGLSNIIFSATTTVWDVSGKIGPALSILNSNIIGTCSTLNGVSTFSLTFWCLPKTNSSITANWCNIIALGSKSADNTTSADFRFESSYNNNYILSHHNNSGDPIGGGTASLVSARDQWYHVAVIANNETHTIRYYIDGSQLTTSGFLKTHNGGHLDGTIKLANEATDPDCLINDVRIYDHALSAKEVKELAKGLVLHYKLDNNGMGNPNLINNFDTSFISYSDGPSTLFTNQMNGGTQEIISNFNGAIKCLHLHNLGGNGRQYRTLVVQTGKTYTISADYYSDNAQGTAWRGELSGGNYSWLGANAPYTTPGQWQRLSYTYSNLTSDATIYFFIYCANGQDCYVKNIKIEEGLTATPWNSGDWFNNKIYDSSGYQYNGTIIGSLFYSNDTARYSSATIFDGNTSGILIENLPLSNIINTAVTYSFWIKPEGENGARSIYFGSYSSTSWSIEKTTGNKLRSYWNGSPDETSSATINDNVWQHIAITKNGTNEIKVYIDGELKWTSSAAHNNLTFPTTYRIGRDTRSGDGTSYHGLMSDFRIYVTALSAEDVKELYNTSASIDHDGNVYAREFNNVESLNNFEINHKGQMIPVDKFVERDEKLASIIKNDDILGGCFYEY